MPTDVKGYLPGGEDRTQWIFEGEWTEEEMQPCLDFVQQYIREHRASYDWDITNFFQFSYLDSWGERHYFASRANWRYDHMGATVQEMLGKLRNDLYSRV